jgi:ABC-type nitrate/sulfonate/bicarbonate transport system permease component
MSIPAREPATAARPAPRGLRAGRARPRDPGEGSSRSYGPVAAVTVRVIAAVVILALWQLTASAFAPAYIPRPSRTLAQIPAVLGDQQFLSAAASTLLAVLEGLIIAAVIGTAAGLVMGRLRDVDRLLRLYVNSFYAMPIVALVPLLTVWFGYTPAARLAIIVIEATLPIVFNVAEGVRAAMAGDGGGYEDVARAFRAPWWRVWTGVALPACLPSLLAGLDLAIGRALIGAVVAEFIAGLNGIGYYILFNVRSFHQDEALVAVGVLVAFALLLRALINLAVRLGLPWYQPA